MIWKPEQIWLILAEIGNQLRLKGEDSMRNRVFQYNLGITLHKISNNYQEKRSGEIWQISMWISDQG